MQIIKTVRFDDEFLDIYRHIAKDSIANADNFRNQLDIKIENLVHFPLKCRQSSKINDKNIRELIFKSYVIPYKIYEDKIIVLGIFNQNIWNIS